MNSTWNKENKTSGVPKQIGKKNLSNQEYEGINQSKQTYFESTHYV